MSAVVNSEAVQRDLEAGEGSMTRRVRSTPMLLSILLGAASCQVAPAAAGDTLTEARDGYVVSSHREGASVTTRVLDDREHAVLFTREAPDEDLAQANRATLAAYHCRAVPGDALVAYDGFGCDSVAGPLSCTRAGSCCDTHDYCYAQNGCTAASWGCDPLVCDVAGLAAGASSALIGVPSWLATAGASGACHLIQDSTCSSQNLSDACHSCNRNAVGCILGSPLTNPGPSSCCGLPSDDPQSCGKDRDGCETHPDGRCDKPCTTAGDCNAGRCDSGTGKCRNDCTDNSDCASGKCQAGNCRPPQPPAPTPCLTCSFPPGPWNPFFPFPFPFPWMPWDPNEMVGPPGTGPDQAVSHGDTLAYEIEFENVAPATAPAQEVDVVAYLDPNLDWSTVSFGQVSYGGRVLAIPAGSRTYYLTDIPANDGCIVSGTATGDLAVKLSLVFNVVNGRLEMTLKAIDTATNDWPADASAGLLPPTGTICANGHLTYTVRPRADAPMMSVIDASASIIFDSNPALTTNIVWNTIE